MRGPKAPQARQLISESFCRLVHSKVRNLGAKHGIKAVRSLKAVLPPQSAAA